jgi:hypothetical protein
MYDTPCGASAAERQYQRGIERAEVTADAREEARAEYLDRMAEEMLASPIELANILADLLDSPADRLLGIAIRDMFASRRNGGGLHGIDSLREMLKSKAIAMAARELGSRPVPGEFDIYSGSGE